MDIIRKVVLRMNKGMKFRVIKELVENNGMKQRATIELGCTVRTINRLIKGYKEEGKSFFIHGNQGKKPSITLDDTVKQNILNLYRTKYEDSNLTHFSELLEEFEGIKVSTTTIRSILMQEFILSPNTKRSSKKALQKKFEDMKKNTTSKKEAAIIQSVILDIEDAHPRRPRSAYFGEMLQIDASVHHWFGKNKTQLHIAVDDATGIMTGAHFDSEETLNGYYNVLYQVLTTYGIPYMFYTDRRTVFEYKQKNLLLSKKILLLNLDMHVTNWKLRLKPVAFHKPKAVWNECSTHCNHDYQSNCV